ncbi:MAG: hypothetical protein VX223_13105 [Myxococcota bacterium]|nr:hypothetical protein [Myxococcota bacterium]
MEQSNILSTESHNVGNDNHDLGAAFEAVRRGLEYLWPEEEQNGSRMATEAVTRAVKGLSLELEYLWPNAA